jgi:hypothetical protein
MNQPSLLDTTAAFAMLIDAPPALSDKARKIEGVLRVKLSDGFGRICEFLDDSDVVADTIGQPGAEAESDTIIALTQVFRSDLGLPTPYIVLGATDDRVLLMACEGAPTGSGAVHLVERGDLGHFTIGTMLSNSRSWPSFVDYFEEVLEPIGVGA